MLNTLEQLLRKFVAAGPERNTFEVQRQLMEQRLELVLKTFAAGPERSTFVELQQRGQNRKLAVVQLVLDYHCYTFEKSNQ